MRNIIKRIACKLWPELESKTYFPQLAIVIEVPDPPVSGGVSTPERPRYAVNVRMLRSDLTVDEEMPLIRDVPVTLPAAANDRSFAALPQPGTIVEVAFGFGKAYLPFIRSVFPFHLSLPEIDAMSQRWQQSTESFQQVDADGNWCRKTEGKIQDIAGEEWITKAPKIYLGNNENLLQVISEYMETVSGVLSILSRHTHPATGEISQRDDVSSAAKKITTQKARVDVIKK